MDVFLIILIGVVGGVIGGMGMGGGTLLIPLLSVFLHFDQKLAQAINLISFLPMAVVVLIIHIRNKLVEKQALWYIILPALATSIPFALLATKLNSEVLRRAFGVFLLLLGIANLIYFIVKEMRLKRKNEGDAFHFAIKK